ncbi:MAG TPA: SurA N-terminal domain-containing protein [Micropepsaceae bacterium]|jgi:peptidyl-prolyl cis-trans isomerase D
MLQQLRIASKSWVASVVIGILVLAFALWGVADIFTASGVDNVVAKVGGTEISANDYDLQLKNQIRNLSAQTKNQLTMEQAKAIGLDKNVLDQVIARAALDEQVKSLGLTASQDTIATQIRTNQSFRGADGSFDPNLFLRTLQDNGMSEQAFVAATSSDIAREQLLNAVTDGMVAPPGLARLLYDFINEQRVIDYLVVTPEEAGQVPEPSQADLEAYHKAHAAQFSSPEYRSFDYVQIGPDQVAGEIQISDDDIKAEYDSHKADYDKPEQREVEQIAFPTQEAANAAAMKIKTGADFTALAHERGLKDADLKLGTLAAAGLDPKLSAPVFAVPEGGVTPAVQGPFGWVILRAAKVIPGEMKTLDQVKDEIKAGLVKTRDAAKLTEIANKFEDERGSGGTLAEAAMKEGLMLHHVAAIDRMGMTPEKSEPEIAKIPQVLEQVFQTEVGEDSDLFQSPDGQYFAVKVNSSMPPAIKPLDSVREEVKEGFIADARNKLLQTKVQTLAAEAMKSGSLAAAGKALGHPPVTSMPLKRGDMGDVFSMQLIGQLFAVPPGAVITGPAGKGNGIVLARVVKVTHPEPDVSSADYVNFRRTAAQQLSMTAVDSLAAAARKKAGVNIHQATVQRVLGDAQQ